MSEKKKKTVGKKANLSRNRYRTEQKERWVALTQAYVSKVYSFTGIRKYQKLTSVHMLGENSDYQVCVKGLRDITFYVMQTQYSVIPQCSEIRDAPLEEITVLQS